ncbi:acyl-CoA N-acyltransferase [Cokeromyces recurvatus]|uniref:acyl-CoA N-acyltransferase n=1 Tax=Cokeromyces recurvatus TaxID=90255 RepID=UPI002220B67B|nr:acyl-CoA N-acyltransferase [Cokeromyces recurvatus]KAI7901514.1 acyl-CoA N-acyltransferase [Cokeromyces recurvatus]
MTIQVREITDSSYAQTLSDLGRRLFSDTFSDANTASNMQAYLDESYTVEIQTKELADPSMSTFMAYDTENDSPIGFCQLRQNKDVYDFIQDPDAIELQRIYVDKRYIGKGVGKALLNSSLEKARQLGKQTMWLGVWEHNPSAISFYTRQGFYKVGSHTFKLGSQEDTDHIMIKKL